MCFAVCQFWVSDWGGPQDDTVWQPDRRSSLCVWRICCLLCHSGLPASGHTADTLCSSGRTQGSTFHCWYTVAVNNLSYHLLVFFFLGFLGDWFDQMIILKITVSIAMWIWQEINWVTSDWYEIDGGNGNWLQEEKRWVPISHTNDSFSWHFGCTVSSYIVFRSLLLPALPKFETQHSQFKFLQATNLVFLK